MKEGNEDEYHTLKNILKRLKYTTRPGATIGCMDVLQDGNVVLPNATPEKCEEGVEMTKKPDLTMERMCTALSEILAMSPQPLPVGMWHDALRPHCAQSDTGCSGPRMEREPHGFRCPECGSVAAWDLTHLVEPPIRNMGGNLIFSLPQEISPVMLDEFMLSGRGLDIVTYDFHKKRETPSMPEILEGWGAPIQLPLENLPFLMHQHDEPKISKVTFEGAPGPIGHPVHHRRLRKMRKRSRQINRRKK